MRIDRRHAGDVVVLGLRGNITLGGDDDTLAANIHSLLSQGIQKFVINIEDVKYIDSAGLGALVRAYTNINREGGTMLLSHPSARIFDLLSISKLRSVYELVPSVDDGLAVFQSLEHLHTRFEASCPVCKSTGTARFVMREFFDSKNCSACGVAFRIIRPEQAFVDVVEHTTARLSSMSLPTYYGEHIHVQFGLRCTMVVPRRLDLFSFEVLEKAWYVIPGPRRIVLDVASIEEFTELGVARFLELSDDRQSVDRTVYLTQHEQGQPSAITANLAHTGRAYDFAAFKKLDFSGWEDCPRIPVRVARRLPP